MHVQFPPSFLWGAALSSYQCEGGNLRCDWHDWELARGLTKAGLACNHYHSFDSDFKSARLLSLNALRISLEWSRVHLESKQFSPEELEHYRQVFDSLQSYRLKPVVALHHFTNPLWFMKGGGWLKSANVDSFLSYLKTVVEAFKEHVRLWLIFNEPLVYIVNGYLEGIWPPGYRSYFQAKKALANMVSAYLCGYQEIKRIYRDDPAGVEVSQAHHMRVFTPCDHGLPLLNAFSAAIRNHYFNYRLLDYLRRKRSLDFLAVNYYCRDYTRFKGLTGTTCASTRHSERTNQLGWHIYAQGLYELLMSLKKYHLPVMVTENGTAENQEYLYQDFLITHLRSLARALSEGVDIRGYFWWSLMDNFEWDKGFKPRFGLYEVDYKDFRRNCRPFALHYGSICKDNRMRMEDFL